MAEGSLEAPGSATPRLRALINALLLLTFASLAVAVVLRDQPLAMAPGAGVFFVTAVAVVLFVSTYLFFEQAALTGQRAYLHLAVGCQLAAVLAVGWALASQGALTMSPDTAANSQLGVVGRASAALAFLVPVMSSVSALRREPGTPRPVTDRVIATAAAATLAGGLAWLAAVAAYGASLEPHEAAPWPVAAVWTLATAAAVVAAIKLAPKYRSGTILHRVLMLAVALGACAVLLAGVDPARFSVGWYAAHVYALLACLAVLTMLLAHLSSTDRRQRRTLAELRELRLAADAAYHELRFQAGSDALTGVANRHHFLSRLRSMIDSCTRLGNDRFLAVAVIDLNDFKEINDRCGHGVGDAVLQEVAFRISKHLGRADLVGRLGGDEFGVAFGFAHPHRAQARLAAIMAAISRPIGAEGLQVRPQASVGWCVCPQDGTRPGELYRNADRAMYSAKRQGDGMALPYASSMTSNTERDSAVRADVSEGIADGRISLAYQPILDLRHGGVWGFEALVRLARPDGSLVVAAEFLPAVVAGGQLPALGHAVLDRLASDLPLITALTDARITFNLSAQEASDHSLIDRFISGDLAAYADRLVVEVAESALTDPHVPPALAALRERGLTVAVDDFGTGMSNMATLSQAHPGLIKVDGEFTHEVEHSPAAAAVIRSAVNLAEGLGCSVVAEAVETPKQQALLPDLGVSLGQGFVLGRPISPGRAGQAHPAGEHAASH